MICSNYNDKIQFYGNPCAHMDNGAKCLVTNLAHLLEKVRYFDNKLPCKVKTREATSKISIVPTAIGYIRVKTNNIDGYIDVQCYYSPQFTPTLLSENNVLRATGHPEKYMKELSFKKF